MTAVVSDIQNNTLIRKYNKYMRNIQKSGLATEPSRASVSFSLICTPDNWGQSAPCINEKLKHMFMLPCHVKILPLLAWTSIHGRVLHVPLSAPPWSLSERVNPEEFALVLHRKAEQSP